MTVAVGVAVVTVAGVIIGRMLALGVDLFPGMAGGLLGVAATGVGFMLAVGGSEVLALFQNQTTHFREDIRIRTATIRIREIYNAQRHSIVMKKMENENGKLL